MSLDDAIRQTKDRSAMSLALSRRAVKAGSTSIAGLFSGGGRGYGYGGSWVEDRARINNASLQLEYFRGWPYAAIRAVAQRVASQPIRVAKKGKGKGNKPFSRAKSFLPSKLKALDDVEFRIIEGHSLATLLDDPNDFTVGSSLRFATAASLEITGRAFWLLGEDGKIYYVPTSWVERPVHREGKYFAGWMVRPEGRFEAVEIPGDDMAYFSYPDPSDPLGAVSPLQSQAKAIVADEAIQTAQAQAFSNGLFPGMMVTTGRHPDAAGGPGERPALSGEQRAELVTTIKRMCGGAFRNGEPLILDSLIEDVKRISNTPQEMDFLNSGLQTKARIMQGLGVNPIILGEIQNANRASAAVADQHFCSTKVNPIVALMSEVITQWVAPRFGDGVIAYIEPAEPNDPDTLRAEMDMLVREGAITVNEFRGAFGYPPVPDGDQFIGAADLSKY